MRIVSLLILTIWIVVWALPVALAHLLKKKALRSQFCMLASKGIVFLCGVRVKVIGEPSAGRPLLLMSNHLSYLDIPVLASVVDGRFVAKNDIARWPVIGWICKITGVVFIDRRPSKIEAGQRAVQEILDKGDIVMLFPEATTGDGKRLLSFKPAFFELAQDAVIQPVAIAYRKIRGLPIDYGQWPLIAWYGDMMLLPHLWKLLSLGRIDVEVHFLPPVASDGKSRKILASQVHKEVSSALELAPSLNKD